MKDGSTLAVVSAPSHDGPGAYALVVVTGRPLSVAVGRRPPTVLAAGTYLYAGSARGPGGIGARVGRHARRDKAVRWHIDRLTSAAGVALAVLLPEGRECAIVEAARQWPGVTLPLPGFGSSDCRRCPSHLLRLPDGFDVAARAEALARACGAPQAILWRPGR